MKTSLLLTAAIISISCLYPSKGLALEKYSLVIQQQPTPDEMAKKETDWMNKELTLSPIQFTQVDSINHLYAGKSFQARQDNAGDRESMRNQMHLIREQKHDALAKVLTSDQLTRYDAAEQSRRGRGGNFHNN